MSSSQSLRPSTAQGARFDDKPLWNHVQVLTVADGGGGNRTWVCNYCNKKVVGSYTKVKGHLLRLPHHNVEGCGSITPEVLEAITKEHEAAETKKAQLALNARKKAEYVSIPEGSDLLQQKKRKGIASQSGIPDAFNVAQRDVADKEAARMFYASGLPFNFARSPYFRKYSLTLANSRFFFLHIAIYFCLFSTFVKVTNYSLQITGWLVMFLLHIIGCVPLCCPRRKSTSTGCCNQSKIHGGRKVFHWSLMGGLTGIAGL